MFEKLIIKEKLCVKLDNASGSNVVPIYHYVPYPNTTYKVVKEYLELSNIKAISWIYNLAPIVFPVFELEDTESKKLLAAINLEWKSPRIGFDILLKVADASWEKIQAFSLLNADPYPYREFSIGDHLLGNNAMIGFRVSDANFGLLQSTPAGQDEVVIFADLTRQITIDEPQVPVIINLSGTTTPPVVTPPTSEDDMPLKIVSANYTAVNLDRILVKADTDGLGQINITLPATPVEGNEVEIITTSCVGNSKAIIKQGESICLGYNPSSGAIIYSDNNHRGGKLLYTQAEGWVKFPGVNTNFAINTGGD